MYKSTQLNNQKYCTDNTVVFFLNWCAKEGEVEVNSGRFRRARLLVGNWGWGSKNCQLGLTRNF